MSTHSLRFSPEDTAPQEVTLLNASSSLYEGDWSSIPPLPFLYRIILCAGRTGGNSCLKTKSTPISKDDLIIVNPHINHTEISRENPPLSYFTVGVDGLSFSFNDQKEYRIFNCRKKKTDLLFYFNSLFQELDNQSEGYEKICIYMLNILILQLRRITDSPFELITAQHPSRECANIKRFLDSNYGENISLDHLSAISHLNKYYLSMNLLNIMGFLL